MPILPDIPMVEATILQQANAFRSTEKLVPLMSDPLLTKAAREFARFLAAAPVFSHEADGRRPIDRVTAAGYQACAVAENLAWHSDTRGFETEQLARLSVEGWKKSPGHRKNMLMEHATETGVAVAKASRAEKYFAVQLLGRPSSLKYTFEVENRAARSVSYMVGGEEARIEPRTAVRHTACAPAEVSFELKPGGLLGKPVRARFEAKSGLVFRLEGSGGGEVRVVELAGR